MHIFYAQSGLGGQPSFTNRPPRGRRKVWVAAKAREGAERDRHPGLYSPRRSEEAVPGADPRWDPNSLDGREGL